MTTIILHTEDRQKLKNFFSYFNTNFEKNKFNILIHSKNYLPWDEESILNEITSFKTYYCYTTTKSKVSSVIELINKTKNEDFVLIDEDFPEFSLKKNTQNNFNYLFSNGKEILSKNLDTKYESIRWFIIDSISQILNQSISYKDTSVDSIRYHEKVLDNKFFNQIIYIDGGLGDHVMALPLLESLQPNVFISCKYPQIFSHLNLLGFVDWNDGLFGGYERSVYDYGSNNNCGKIIDAFFEMYGYKRKQTDILKYNGDSIPNSNLKIQDKNVVLICTSAAKIQNQDSNKDWRDLRWMKLVHELKKLGYYVIQVGTKSDNQIPNVNVKFLDQPLPNLCSLIKNSSLWISVDTFFHHFAASIKPNVGICLTPFYNNHAKHVGVTYIEKDCGKDFSERKWWLDLQQPERKECMDLIQVDDVLECIKDKNIKVKKPKSYKVIDTFIFGGEIEMLKMRLDYLYDSVDFFVFSESTKTHSGDDKELVYIKNIDEFKQFEDKIHFIVYNPDTTGLDLKPNEENIFSSDLWKLERGQRDILKEKIKEISDDDTLILHGDLDEFPNKEKFDEARSVTKNLYLDVVTFDQPTYYYSPLHLLDFSWCGTVGFNNQTLINCAKLHMVRERRFSCYTIENGGYHFSFFNTPEKISQKIKNYVHQEYNKNNVSDIEKIKFKIENNLDVLDRPEIKLIKQEKIHKNFPKEFFKHDIFLVNVNKYDTSNSNS